MKGGKEGIFGVGKNSEFFFLISCSFVLGFQFLSFSNFIVFFVL